MDRLHFYSHSFIIYHVYKIEKDELENRYPQKTKCDFKSKTFRFS